MKVVSRSLIWIMSGKYEGKIESKDGREEGLRRQTWASVGKKDERTWIVVGK